MRARAVSPCGVGAWVSQGGRGHDVDGLLGLHTRRAQHIANHRHRSCPCAFGVERGARAAEHAPDADVRRLVEKVIAQGLREGASERAFLLTSILDGLLSAHVRVLQYGIDNGFVPYEVERDLPDLAGVHEAVLGHLVAKGLATVMTGTLGGGGRYFLTRLGRTLAQVAEPEAAESG